MGRKKKRLSEDTREIFKPLCYYCEKEYPDEEKLVNHQRAVHFKCPTCNKRFDNGRALVTHAAAMHKEVIDQIPHALSDRRSIDPVIQGMRGVPSAFIIQKAAGTDLELFLLENRVKEHPLFGNGND